jgi:hypothetical protein
MISPSLRLLAHRVDIFQPLLVAIYEYTALALVESTSDFRNSLAVRR